MWNKHTDSGVTGGDNRQFRSVFSQYGQYREKIFRLLQERVKKPETQASLAVVGTLILIAGLGISALRPTLLTISSLIKEIGDEQRLIVALEDKFRALAAAQGFLEDMKGDLLRIDWAVPGDQEFQVFVKEVEILAKEKGLAAVEISQAGFRIGEGAMADIQGKTKFLAMTVSIGGTEAAIRDFLADLIKMDRLVLIKSVNLSSVSNEQRQEEPYQVRGSAAIEIMYAPENSENSDSGQSDSQTVRQSDSRDPDSLAF